ncbi:MAG: hypothetical protein ABMA64_21715 [Myxococcota bacterium]
MTAHLSTLSLHRLRYGELDLAASTAARAHLASCPMCAGRLAVQERERAAFVARPVPDTIRQLGVEEAPRRVGWWRELYGLGLALCAAAALFVVVPSLRSDPAEADAIRFRGQLPAIEAWVDQGDGPRLLREGDRLSAGHRVQLSYDPRGASAVAIAGRDSTGAVEVYTTNAPTGIGLVQMPFALTLDDAPGEQELFVVTSDRPLDEAAVKAALTAGVPGARVARIAIPKAERKW